MPFNLHGRPGKGMLLSSRAGQLLAALPGTYHLHLSLYTIYHHDMVTADLRMATGFI
jgi:hypothetical protein